MTVKKINIFWFRRDLRLDDNIGLHRALNDKFPVLPIFIFDDNIIEELPKDDARISFIYELLENINDLLRLSQSSLLVLKGKPLEVLETLIQNYDVQKVFMNKDYEPYAKERDLKISTLLSKNNIELKTYKDQVIFEEDEILKDNGTPYTIQTYYKRKWLEKYHFNKALFQPINQFNNQNFLQYQTNFPTLEKLGFVKSKIKVKPYLQTIPSNYNELRDYPDKEGCSNLSPHLRFGSVSIRRLVQVNENNNDFINELIWREFFSQILYHFPQVITQSFKPAYDNIQWKNNPEDFEKWKEGKTGFPLVDAGMRELNETGYMHNRVRMICASFLCKQLLIDWRWGEAYFALKLLDFDLASNNGNWQWAAGCGCDAAPYFRIFNPDIQLKKFDSAHTYVRKWINDFDELTYPKPMINLRESKEQTISAYKKALQHGR